MNLPLRAADLSTATLHYIFDPLCGWCYAAAPLVQAARALAGLQVQFHGGGMMTGVNRRAITPQWRDHVLPHDRRIAELTGQPFGQAYFEGLLRDTGAVMDSAPPITAVLAAEAVAGRGLDMIDRVQRAHFVEGRRIAEPQVLQDLAAQLDLPAQAFAQAMGRLTGTATQAHIAGSRKWLARASGQGFPTFALSWPDGSVEALDTGRWLGLPEAWREHLRRRVARLVGKQTMAASRAALSPAYGPAG